MSCHVYQRSPVLRLGFRPLPRNEIWSRLLLYFLCWNWRPVALAAQLPGKANRGLQRWWILSYYFNQHIVYIKNTLKIKKTWKKVWRSISLKTRFLYQKKWGECNHQDDFDKDFLTCPWMPFIYLPSTLKKISISNENYLKGSPTIFLKVFRRRLLKIYHYLVFFPTFAL